MKIAKTAIIYPGVILGENAVVEDYCIIGCPSSSENKETRIGKNAHIRSHTVIYEGNTIGDFFSTGNKANIRENNSIGNNVSIGTLSIIEHHCIIKDNARVHSGVFIPEFSILEEKCWVGPAVVMTNAKYPNNLYTKEKLKGPTIGRKAIIGANVTILPGVTIGECCLIGSGAIVDKDTESCSLYIGNPARKVKEIQEIQDYEDYTTM